MNVASMSPDNDNDAMRPEYELRGGVRGQYYERYQQEANVFLLDPDEAADPSADRS
jgi:hypothetical protein